MTFRLTTDTIKTMTTSKHNGGIVIYRISRDSTERELLVDGGTTRVGLGSDVIVDEIDSVAASEGDV